MRVSLEEAIAVSQTKPPVCKHHAVLVKPSLWPETETVDACDKSSKASHSVRTLNPPRDQKCQTSKSALGPERNCGGGNCESGTAKCQFSNERKAVGNLTLEKNKDTVGSERNSSGHKEPTEIERILEPLSPIKSPFKYHDSISASSTISMSERKGIIVNPNPSTEISKILEPISPIKTPFKNQDGILDDTPKNKNHFYDKEDIPFTPGRVQRTKQEIEEKSLTRTMSFDSGFPVRTHSTPSTPPEGATATSSTAAIRRSHSLRGDCGKWRPLPAGPQRRGSQSAGRRSACLSVSTPSVVEAVNR